MSEFKSTKVIELGSCAFRQPDAVSHCKYVHGYQLKAKFWFGCDVLDEKNWVVDFAGLKELKAILQHQFDHTLNVSSLDPLLPLFKQLHDAGGCDLRVMDKGVGIERTAEWCFETADKHVREITNNRCWVDQVEVFEHELNSAIFTNTQQIVKQQPVAETTPLEAALETIIAAAPKTEPEPAPVAPSNSRAAHVGSNVSSGKGDWFKGTSWGNQ